MFMQRRGSYLNGVAIDDPASSVHQTRRIGRPRAWPRSGCLRFVFVRKISRFAPPIHAKGWF